MNRIVCICFFLLCSLSAWAVPDDSLNIRTIHGKKYIMHLVKKSETVYSICQRYQITRDQLATANPVDLNKLKKGILLKIPFREPATRSKPGTNGNADSSVNATHANADEVSRDTKTRHIVLPGETLFKIASTYKVSVPELMRWNGLKESKINSGQELVIRASASLVPYLPWNKPDTTVQTPTVSSSESVVEFYATIQLGEGSQVSIQRPSASRYISVYFTESNRTHILELSDTPPPADEQTIRIGADILKVLGITNTAQRVVVKIIEAP